MFLLDNTIQYIIDNGLATAKDTDIFKEYAPKTPDDCTIVYEYNGSPPAMFTNMSVRSIQIVSRAKTQAVAKPQAWNLYKLFHQDSLQITLGTQKAIIKMRNTPIKIGVDELGRCLWAFNMALTINQT